MSSCKVITAKTAGFCFGVDRAVKMTYDAVEAGKKVATFGPLIHNPQVVESLASKGVRVIDDPNQAQKEDTVIIRSHGVGLETARALEESGAKIIDATCPFVKRIHKLAFEYSSEGRTVLIAGDKNHPEVIGICGHCLGNHEVFADSEELTAKLKKSCENSEKGVAILAQTTYNIEMWEKCKRTALSIMPDAVICDTICSATSDRQKEAKKLSEICDMMIIVGGRHSSNTIKLCEMCSDNCKCALVEDASELYSIDFSAVKSIGISAGASTPAYIIKEVQTTMSEILKNQDEEFNFEEALEQTFKKIYTGKRVTGYITSVKDGSDVIVDIGTKHTGYIPASEISEDPNVKATDILHVGDEVELVVTKINDQDGIVTLSKKQVDAQKGYETILKAKEEGTVLTGVVTNVIKGGVLVASNGMKVFIPASQATAHRDDNLEELLKKTVRFKILEVNEQRKRAVGSIRAVAKEERAAAEAKFFETAEVGQTMTGEVKSITDYGVFVDLGGVDGLVRKMDLTWARIKHPSDVVSVGDRIEVTIKDIDKENKKVSLVYKKTEDNPWEIFKANYEVGQTVKAKIVSITDFGAFAEIIPGIDGLIHISQIANQRVSKVSDILTVGQEVEAKITEADLEKKRISLSMRALLPEEEAAEEEASEETNESAE